MGNKKSVRVNATVQLVITDLMRKFFGIERNELRLCADGSYVLDPPMHHFPAMMGITLPPSPEEPLGTPANVTLYEDGTYDLEIVNVSL